MSKARVHLEAGPFGLAACGKQHVDTTKATGEVTCKGCQATVIYAQRSRLRTVG